MCQQSANIEQQIAKGERTSAMVLRLVVLVGATKLLLKAAGFLRLGVPVGSLRSSVDNERSLLVDKRLGDRDDVLDEALDHVGRERLSDLFGDGEVRHLAEEFKVPRDRRTTTRSISILPSPGARA